MFNCYCNSKIIDTRTNSPIKDQLNELNFNHLNQSKITIIYFR